MKTVLTVAIIGAVAYGAWYLYTKNYAGMSAGRGGATGAGVVTGNTLVSQGTINDVSSLLGGIFGSGDSGN